MLRSGVFLLWIASAAYSQIELPEVDEPATGVVIIEHTSVEPGGSIWIGVRITMKPTWHVYWKNPGDSGLAPSVKWTLPKGVTASPIHWPTPHRISTPPLMTYGYDDVVLLMVELKVDKDFKDDTFKVRAHAKWLVCADVCLDGSVKQNVDIPVRKGKRKPTGWADEFKKARAALPKEPPPGAFDAWPGALVLSPMKIGLGKNARVHFFPAKAGWIEHADRQVFAHNELVALLHLPLTAAARKDTETKRLQGVLAIQEGEARRAYRIDLPITRPKLGGK